MTEQPYQGKCLGMSSCLCACVYMYEWTGKRACDVDEVLTKVN